MKKTHPVKMVCQRSLIVTIAQPASVPSLEFMRV
jgi:hypothetical protein